MLKLPVFKIIPLLESYYIEQIGNERISFRTYSKINKSIKRLKKSTSDPLKWVFIQTETKKSLVLMKKSGDFNLFLSGPLRMKKAKTEKDLEYWKKMLLNAIKSDSMEKSLEDILFPGIADLPEKTKDLLLKARGYPIGTKRTWSGKEYKKVSGGTSGKGKWVRTYSETESRGAKQAIRNVQKKITDASSMEELLEIVQQNSARFQDKDGKILPIVKEFISAARGTEAGKKEKIEVKEPEKEFPSISELTRMVNDSDIKYTSEVSRAMESIKEGEGYLKSGKTPSGKKMSSEQRPSIQRAVNNSKRKVLDLLETSKKKELDISKESEKLKDAKSYYMDNGKEKTVEYLKKEHGLSDGGANSVVRKYSSMWDKEKPTPKEAVESLPEVVELEQMISASGLDKYNKVTSRIDTINRMQALIDSGKEPEIIQDGINRTKKQILKIIEEEGSREKKSPEDSTLSEYLDQEKIKGRDEVEVEEEWHNKLLAHVKSGGNIRNSQLYFMDNETRKKIIKELNKRKPKEEKPKTEKPKVDKEELKRKAEELQAKGEAEIKQKKEETERRKQEAKEFDVESKFSGLDETARRAYLGTSFYPEKRGKDVIESYKQELKEDLEKLPDEESRSRYADKYISNFKNWLGKKGNVMSAMITGPANFPVARNRKANNAEMRAYEDFRNFRERAGRAEERQRVLSPEEDLDAAVEKVDRLIVAQELMRESNKIIRKKDLTDDQKVLQMVGLGLKESTAKESLKPDFGGRVGFPSYALTNNNAKIKNAKEKIETMKTRIASKESFQPIPFEGGEINIDNDRVTIRHDEKPSKEVIDKIKSRGFRWSRNYASWSRKHTARAIQDAKEIVGIMGKSIEEPDVIDDILNDVETIW